MAASGSTSGSGLASANTMAPAAMAAMSSPDKIPGADTPMNTSASRSAPARSPAYPPALVLSAIQRRLSSRPGRPACTAPASSQTTTWAAPLRSSSLSTAGAAAPAPPHGGGAPGAGQPLGRGGAGGAAPRHGDAHLAELLAHHPQRVGQRGHHH